MTPSKTEDPLARLTRRVKDFDFKSIEDFVMTNLHYLPEWQQELFHLVRSGCNQPRSGGGFGQQETAR